MKFGEKKRLQKEQERFEKQQAQKKKNKKQITILVSILAVLFVIVGIGALTENNAKNLPDSSAIVSSTSGAETPESTISETPSKESESSQEKTTSPETTQAPTAQTQQPTSTVVSIDDIPSYSGSGAYIAINNNVPYFTKADYTTAAFENYSSLDSLGRCGVAYANVCQEIMPTEDRGSIGQVKPTGWHTVKYDCVDGKYLYNRCHLIGYQLSAENANTKNLITGTRYLNVDGMLPFENMVADYIKETNHHVLYRVTPMFDGDNLVATGVLMEALSVEDKGDGICFNVFCYNIQPGVTIDYATGDSTLNETAATTTPAAETTAPASEPSTGTTYILNTNTHKFHYPSCSSVSQMNEANKQEYTGSRDDLIAQGYEPCGRCHP